MTKNEIDTAGWTDLGPAWADSVGSWAANTFGWRFDEASRYCDSPIETRLMLALHLAHVVYCTGFVVWPAGMAAEWDRFDVTRLLYVRPQMKVGRYRVDFLVGLWPPEGPAVVVECDGHDFHERTKAQAARDRSRDRDIQAAGHRVLRFTGSEVYRDPMRCAVEVINHVLVVNGIGSQSDEGGGG